MMDSFKFTITDKYVKAHNLINKFTVYASDYQPTGNLTAIQVAEGKAREIAEKMTKYSEMKDAAIAYQHFCEDAHKSTDRRAIKVKPGGSMSCPGFDEWFFDYYKNGYSHVIFYFEIEDGFSIVEQSEMHLIFTENIHNYTSPRIEKMKEIMKKWADNDFIEEPSKETGGTWVIHKEGSLLRYIGFREVSRRDAMIWKQMQKPH